MEKKQCTKCNEWKELNDFFKDKQKKSGYRPDCKKCNVKETTARAKQNVAQIKFNQLKHESGLTKEIYIELLEEQGLVCAICGKENVTKNRNLSVDHCHINGLVRGLLCTKCNFGLGYFEDNKELLEKAINYLDNNASYKGLIYKNKRQK